MPAHLGKNKIVAYCDGLFCYPYAVLQAVCSDWKDIRLHAIANYSMVTKHQTCVKMQAFPILLERSKIMAISKSLPNMVVVPFNVLNISCKVEQTNKPPAVVKKINAEVNKFHSNLHINESTTDDDVLIIVTKNSIQQEIKKSKIKLFKDVDAQKNWAIGTISISKGKHKGKDKSKKPVLVCKQDMKTIPVAMKRLLQVLHAKITLSTDVIHTTLAKPKPFDSKNN